MLPLSLVRSPAPSARRQWERRLYGRDCPGIPAPQPAPQKVYVPTVTFAEAADEIWPQLNNPNPIVIEEAPVKQVEPQPKAVKKAPKAESVEVMAKEETKPVQKVYVPTVSFEQAADEIWPQLSNPQPIKVEPQVVEVQPAPKQEQLRIYKVPNGGKLVPIPEGKKIKKRFVRADGTEAIIWAKPKKAEEEPKMAPEAKPAPVVEDNKPVQPKNNIKAKHSRKGFRK